jgi:signal transduction histidine kinase
VLGVEADVDYTAVLIDLRRNLYLSTFISAGAGLVFGLFFFFIQRRLNAAEKSLLLARSQAALGRMVAVVSHEIKNPLMIIRGSAERLRKTGRREAEFIVEETDRLNRIVTAYLDFASGKNKLTTGDIDIPEFLEKIKNQFQNELALKQVALKVAPPPAEIKALADPAALRQVLINLILNGAEAAASRPDGEVILKCRQTEESIIIEIADTGPGINQKEIEAIFEPFYTTRTSGSGLGLFHSRRLIENMHGKITVKSKTGGPTTFLVHLPPADKGLS